ncbi:hypothetical protein BP5796_10924 [Coleophoma crateriformis]|uniref:Zn(2)-C6 fungal-type domain-containing protein n=1 Tax=Coleophoma crateriformis TaxID=565419 RepID=A0A3D8QLE8_9HELO|nr:hypothetical protein BP5796_10924 [Coleophoma crateriformis]
MVTRAPYCGDDAHTFRRTSRSGNSHQPIHDRPYSQSLAVNHSSRTYQESFRDDQDDSLDSEGVRKRVAVACGRCRKRKIRCSGESKNGGPCNPCKNAGNDACQFLRVQSTETPMKVEIAEMTFEPAGTRQLAFRPTPHYGNYTAQPYSQQVSSLGPDNWTPYRANSLSGCQYSGKAPHGLSPYQPEYPDVDSHGVDYSVQGNGAQLLSSEYIGTSSYGFSGVQRNWISTPPLSRNSLMFSDQGQTNYGPEHVTYHGNDYTIRSPSSPDGRSYSVGSGLPAPAQVAGNDRVLPYPAINRPVQPAGPYLRSNDNGYNSQHGAQQYNNIEIIEPSALKPAHPSMLSESGAGSSSYGPAGHNLENVPSLQIYQPHPMSVSQQHGEIYSTGGESTSLRGSFQGLSMRNDSTNDLSYSYGPSSDSASSKRESHSSSSSDESSVPALANGHAYIPHNQNSYSTAATPIENRPMAHRSSNSSLQAV